MTAPRPSAARPRRAAIPARRAAVPACRGIMVPARACRALLLAALFALATPAVGAAQQAAGDGYVADVADLPLMAGLEEVTDAGMAFDKPSGRIVEAYAHGAVAVAAVRRFYRETLPQLGWQRLGRDRFAREDERLEIDYLGADGDLTVRYTLQPR